MVSATVVTTDHPSFTQAYVNRRVLKGNKFCQSIVRGKIFRQRQAKCVKLKSGFSPAKAFDQGCQTLKSGHKSTRSNSKGLTSLTIFVFFYFCINFNYLYIYLLLCGGGGGGGNNAIFLIYYSFSM